MFTQTEKERMGYFKEKIEQCNLIIEEHNKMIQVLKDKIQETSDKINEIRSKARIRNIKKCKHEIPENPTIYYDSCGMNWCTFSDYHKHYSCWKCGYIKDEPL